MQLYIITGTHPNTPFDFIIIPFCTAKHVHKEAKRYFFPANKQRKMSKAK